MIRFTATLPSAMPERLTAHTLVHVHAHDLTDTDLPISVSGVGYPTGLRAEICLTPQLAAELVLALSQAIHAIAPAPAIRGQIGQ